MLTHAPTCNIDTIGRPTATVCGCRRRQRHWPPIPSLSIESPLPLTSAAATASTAAWFAMTVLRRRRTSAQRVESSKTQKHLHRGQVVISSAFAAAATASDAAGKWLCSTPYLSGRIAPAIRKGEVSETAAEANDFTLRHVTLPAVPRNMAQESRSIYFVLLSLLFISQLSRSPRLKFTLQLQPALLRASGTPASENAAKVLLPVQHPARDTQSSSPSQAH
jgi:hypothetical protein